MTPMPAVCECCPVTLDELKSQEPARSLFLYKAMWMCPDCLSKERQLTAKSESEAEARIQASRVIMSTNRTIDGQIQLKEDIHNAYTVAIEDLEKALANDPAVENKPLTLAIELKARYENLSQVIFDARELVREGGNQQRAIQTYMNTLLNKLREEERAQFKLSNINYKPEVVKSPKVTKAGKSGGKSLKMSEMKEAAAKYNVPMEYIRTRMIQKNESADEAASKIAVVMAGMAATK